ncbi:MAG: L,D-transpeptidase family protein [Bdellovibrionales bacterium]|nr:L,D-transpeptidase family protein [Bdellovibrionales bacterium]
MPLRYLAIFFLLSLSLHQAHGEEFSPVSQQHQLMQGAIELYQAIEKQGGWESIPKGTPLKLGDESPRVALLKARLAVSEDFAVDTASESTAFTPTLETSIKNFQRRHGLEVDGIVGKKTLFELNIPISERLRTLRLNLPRAKRFENYLEPYFIVVNIAGFELAVIKNNKVILRSAIVVGKPYQETPIFSEKIKYIEFNPYWHIPRSIIQAEILPAIKKNPHYLEEQKMIASIPLEGASPQELQKIKIKQTPGSWNALGKIKFGFPNQYNVYLHDTPAKGLFRRPMRSFSHGCIRVEEAEKLARVLFKEDEKDWDPTLLDKALTSERNRAFYLKSPVPIHIIYRTAWVDVDGSINFRGDIYHRDM